MADKYKTIGVFGGLGPASSWYFEGRLLALNKQAKTDQDHPRVIHFSNSLVPSRVEAIEGRGVDPVPEMIRSLEVLRMAGADFGVMICNTAHVFWDKLLAGTSLPMIHLIQETVSSFPNDHPDVKKVLVLGTTQTVKNNLYKEPLAKLGIEVVVPTGEDQELVMESIFNVDFGVKATETEVSLTARQLLEGVVKRVVDREKITHVIDGCTEISMIFGDSSVDGVRMIDPLSTLARVCLTRAGVEL